MTSFLSTNFHKMNWFGVFERQCLEFLNRNLLRKRDSKIAKPFAFFQLIFYDPVDFSYKVRKTSVKMRKDYKEMFGKDLEDEGHDDLVVVILILVDLNDHDIENEGMKKALEPISRNLKNFIFYFVPVNSPNQLTDGQEVAGFSWSGHVHPKKRIRSYVVGPGETRDCESVESQQRGVHLNFSDVVGFKNTI